MEIGIVFGAVVTSVTKYKILKSYFTCRYAILQDKFPTTANGFLRLAAGFVSYRCVTNAIDRILFLVNLKPPYGLQSSSFDID
jgi:hypothetical protein